MIWLTEFFNFSKLSDIGSCIVLHFDRSPFTSSPQSFISMPTESNSGEECLYLHYSVWRTTYLQKDTFVALVSVVIVNLIAVFPTILLNTLVILAVARRQRLRTKSNTLLACLASTDLLTGLVLQPISIAVDVNRILGVGPFCVLEKLHQIALSAAGLSSSSHLILISIDRYIAIKHPLRYQGIVTGRRVKRAVLLVWAITVCLITQDFVSTFILRYWKLYSVYHSVIEVILFLIISIYIAVIVYSNCYMFFETRRQKKRLRTEQLPNEEAKRIKKDRKAANTLLFVVGALTLAYLPSIITGLVTFLGVKVELRFELVLWSWLSTFYLLNSLFNPIIYCWRHSKLRHACLEILHFRQTENTSDVQMVQQQRPGIQLSTSEAFSIPVQRQDPVLLSFVRTSWNI